MNELESLRELLSHPRNYDIATALRGPDIDAGELKFIFTAPLRVLLSAPESKAMARIKPLREHYPSFQEFERTWMETVKFCTRAENRGAIGHFLSHFCYGSSAIAHYLGAGPIYNNLKILEALADGFFYQGPTEEALLQELWDNESPYDLAL